MNLDAQLRDAIGIAVGAHENQFDRGGNPYILHPLHLMNQLMYDKELAAIAVMHDVIEDSHHWDLINLRIFGFSDRVLTALDLLTHKEEDSYQQYIDKISTNYDAIRVKRKDLEHNSDITRLKGVKEKDLKRMEKYHKAFIQLGKAKEEFK